MDYKFVVIENYNSDEECDDIKEITPIKYNNVIPTPVKLQDKNLYRMLELLASTATSIEKIKRLEKFIDENIGLDKLIDTFEVSMSVIYEPYCKRHNLDKTIDYILHDSRIFEEFADSELYDHPSIYKKILTEYEYEIECKGRIEITSLNKYFKIEGNPQLGKFKIVTNKLWPNSIRLINILGIEHQEYTKNNERAMILNNLCEFNSDIPNIKLFVKVNKKFIVLLNTVGEKIISALGSFIEKTKLTKVIPDKNIYQVTFYLNEHKSKRLLVEIE